MAITNLVDAHEVLAHHNLFVDNLSTGQWKRYVDQSSRQTLEKVGGALSFIAERTRSARFARMARDATSVAKVLARIQKK